jgi:hypothetical protein
MSCKACKSENLRQLEGELTASLRGVDALKLDPVYVCQTVVVCFDCGFAELVIPESQLKLLKTGATTRGS